MPPEAVRDLAVDFLEYETRVNSNFSRAQAFALWLGSKNLSADDAAAIRREARVIRVRGAVEASFRRHHQPARRRA